MPRAGLSGRCPGKAPSDMPAFQPYWGKPAVRNDRGERGDVGIIRSPVRASFLPDCGEPLERAVPTATNLTSIRSASEAPRISEGRMTSAMEPLRNEAIMAGNLTEGDSPGCEASEACIQAQVNGELRDLLAPLVYMYILDMFVLYDACGGLRPARRRSLQGRLRAPLTTRVAPRQASRRFDACGLERAARWGSSQNETVSAAS